MSKDEHFRFAFPFQGNGPDQGRGAGIHLAAIAFQRLFLRTKVNATAMNTPTAVIRKASL